ncbi:hypothetical protein JDV02_003798 [Purpureocillium takamizusanense]|uniref:F-box domain-containing protein n=1 Tax=Purpureocillium takamizusanense TaxID=2060973 RepID=A0A9Q8QDW0_9HYPO|nr:uncharacterized protein JDV02_003798 [Purpureocillium takamizusanense]UNI17457.1 hypothetical protein JDV02_003798 [Purpureocillium takamizusanense]
MTMSRHPIRSRPPPSPLITVPAEVKLLIMSDLTPKELGSVCLVHSSWREISQYEMFNKDIASDAPSAILWAALGGQDDPTGRYEMQCSVLRRFMEQGQEPYHSDAERNAFAKQKVNARYYNVDGSFATALHFAAAKGRLPVVMRLLRYHASLDAMSIGIHAFRSRGIRITDAVQYAGDEARRLGSRVFGAIRGAQWLPLMAPLLLKHYDVVEALVHCKAPAILSHPPITVFHVISALSSEEFNAESVKPVTKVRGRRKAPVSNQEQAFTTPMKLHLRLFKAYPNHLEIGLGTNYWTPLHIAIQRDNEAGFNQLLDHGANVNAATILGCTPLHEAIRRRCQSFMPNTRIPKRSYITHLLEAGADPNAVSRAGHADTPLMCTLRVDHYSWDNRHIKDVEAVMEMLIKHGARINDRGFSGRTIIHRLDEKISSSMLSPIPSFDSSSERLLAFLVNLGGDVNERTYTSSTILSDLVLRTYGTSLHTTQIWPSIKGYFKTLLELGARVPPNDAENVFQAWLDYQPLRTVDIDVFAQCGEFLSQDFIDATYLRIVQRADTKLWYAISGRLRPPTNASVLVATIFQQEEQQGTHPLWHPIRDTLSFDPAYVTEETRETYLHLLVRKLRCGGYTRPSLALKDARLFAERGVPLSARDSDGKTVVQRLRDEGLDFHKDLRLYLMDERDRQNGEY